MTRIASAIDCVVVGAGVLGLAVARAMAQRGHEVLILEAASAIGTLTSARNSEVIHAGMYYAVDSLKASLCVRGNALLYAYCEARGIAHRRCGKLIVATDDTQVAQLHRIQEQARRNGLHDLALLSAAQAIAMEPALQCHAALHSPSTGILDSHAFMLSLLGDTERAGGTLALNAALSHAECGAHGLLLFAQDGTELFARRVVNAAGYGAPALAHTFAGLNADTIPKAYFAKGNYFSLSQRSPFSRLVYPLPQVAGLGVHCTLDLGGQARFGPDVEWVDGPHDLRVDPARAHAFYAEVRKYWPGLKDGALMPAYAGIRPKISGPNAPAADFCIQGAAAHGVPGLVNLFGIESPGLTSALAIAEHVTTLLD